MTKTEYCVSAEEVMALLDGELSATDARAVSAHLERCSECALVMEQLRGTSELLSQWSVPAVSRAVEEVVLERAAAADSRRAKTSGKKFSLKLAVAGGGALVFVAFLLAIGLGRHVSKDGLQTYAKLQQAPEMTDGAVAQSENGAALYEQMGRARQGGPTSPAKARSTAVGGIAGMGSDFQGTSQFAVPPAPMIAREMSLTVMVKDIEAARTSLDSILARRRGYSAHLNASSPENGARNLRASLRVPESELTSAAAELKTLGRVVNESQSGLEVSQQHADLVARLKTARETETRFQTILVQHTGRVSDVLEVEENIARIRGEIEEMEAEQKALEHRVDFATLDVQLVEEYKAKLESSAENSVSTRMHNSFVAGYHNATESLLGIVLFAEEYGPPILIWLAILGVPVIVIWRRYRRIRSGR
jgi:hypothetical protein